MNYLKEAVKYDNLQRKRVTEGSEVPPKIFDNISVGTNLKVCIGNIKPNKLIMDIIKEQIGNYDVIASNSLCVFNYEDVVLDLSYDSVQFRFRVKFIRNNEGPGVRTKPQNNEMLIEVMNIFTRPGGVNEPMVVLTSDDDTPAVSFLCSVLPFDRDSGNFVLFYTFLEHCIDSLFCHWIHRFYFCNRQLLVLQRL